MEQEQSLDSDRCAEPVNTTDFIDANGSDIRLVSDQLNRYDSRALAERAVRIVADHNASRGMYMYLAFHNVHLPNEAPLSTVQKFGRYD